MKTITFFLALGTAAASAQGPLTPPVGAPAAGMKTLTQVEPRTPIETLPFNINTPGSYYLTKNLQFTAASGDAITITTGNVTLDLNGFTLSSTASVTGRGISVSDGLSNILVRNGMITGTTTVAISSGSPRTWTPTSGGFSNGLYATANDPRNFDAENLQVSGCRNTGIYAVYGNFSRCNSKSNGGTGINAFLGTVSNSTASSNCTHGISAYNGSVAGSTGYNNASDGINTTAGSVTGSNGSSNGGTGVRADDSVVTNCMARGNWTAGIWADNSTISNCKATNSGSDGIRGTNSVISTCRASGSDQNAGDGYPASGIYWAGGRQVDNVSDSYFPAGPTP